MMHPDIEKEASLIFGNGKWATKTNKVLGYKRTANGKFAEREIDVTRASTKYITNKAGILVPVASGILGVDYANDAEGAALVEPAATNLLLRSEEFDNASWLKLASATVSGNTEVAPNGTSTADTINLADVSESRVQQSTGLALNTTYTFSIYLKNISLTSGQTFRIQINAFQAAPNDLFAAATVDLFNGTVVYSQAGTAGTGFIGTGSASIVPLLNGWFRVSVTATRGSGGTTSGGVQITRTAGSRSFYAWGAQLETGSVATSYIPTTTAAVTRNADVISKTGVSGFIGQTEGTIYAEVDLRANSNLGTILSLGPNATTYIAILKRANNTIGFEVLNSGVQANISSATVSSGVFKIAAAYSSNDFVLYVNGAQAATDTSGTVPTVSQVTLGAYPNNSFNLNDRIRAAAIIKTRALNQKLQEWTTL